MPDPTPTTTAATAATAADRFDAAAASAGYSEGRSHQMRIAATKLHLSLDMAALWLEGGFTPWATAVWSRNFDSPDAAAAYRDRGLSAEEAYWRSFDERQLARHAPRAPQ
jgi:hypothetical protein